jgi:primary-amine oxidase
MGPHPLQALSLQEVQLAKDIVLQEHDGELVIIREIALQEPPKKELLKFLDLEHSGSLKASSPRPARLAAASYDVIGSDSPLPYFHEAVIDVEKNMRVKHEMIGKEHHAPLKL